MISMTNIQQLLQRESAPSNTSNGTTSGFAESYAQATQSASQDPANAASETATANGPGSIAEPPQHNHHRPKWMAVFDDETTTKAPLVTEQPIDPAQTDDALQLQAIAAPAPELATTANGKPVSGQPTITEQPIPTSQTDKVARDLKSVVTNPAQAVAIGTTKPSTEQPAVKEHRNQQAVGTQKLTTEQLASKATAEAKLTTRISAANASQLAAATGADKLNNVGSVSPKPNQSVISEQPIPASSSAPKIAAVKSALPIQLTPQWADLATELNRSPELMRQNSTAATTQEQLLAAQVTKDTVPMDAAMFSLDETANPNSLNATQSVAQSNSMVQQTFVADTAGTAPQLTAKLGTQAWQQQLSQQVSQLVLQSDQSVALRLHPAELGSLMVQMKVEDGAAQLSIQSGNAQVRQALEQALPQLRDALANQGIDLGQTHVGSQSARDFGKQPERHASSQQENTSDSLAVADNTDNDLILTAPTMVSAGSLDLYA